MQDTTQPSLAGTLSPHLTNLSTWTRGAFILLFAIAFWLCLWILGAVVAFQFGHLLFTGRLNDQLLAVSKPFVAFMSQIVAFITCTTESRPFPFTEWPKG
jgi:hypothetical protein